MKKIRLVGTKKWRHPALKNYSTLPSYGRIKQPRSLITTNLLGFKGATCDQFVSLGVAGAFLQDYTVWKAMKPRRSSMSTFLALDFLIFELAENKIDTFNLQRLNIRTIVNSPESPVGPFPCG